MPGFAIALFSGNSYLSVDVNCSPRLYKLHGIEIAASGVGEGVGFMACGPLTREEIGVTDQGDDEMGVNCRVEGARIIIFGEVAEGGPEGVVVDKEVDAVAVGF